VITHFGIPLYIVEESVISYFKPIEIPEYLCGNNRRSGYYSIDSNKYYRMMKQTQ
jgi:hypothetical protein